jgi:hypothetical protein
MFSLTETASRRFGAGAVLALAHTVEFGHSCGAAILLWSCISGAHQATPDSQLSLTPARNRCVR